MRKPWPNASAARRGHPYEQGFDLRLWPNRLDQPERWTRPRMIFVNSMSDLFHKDIPVEFVDRVFSHMERADWHVFLALTKRSTRMRDYMRNRYARSHAPSHIWCGVSVEDADGAARIRHLRGTPAAVRFLSAEPLIGPVGMPVLDGIDWVIVGGESGTSRRPMDPDWARSLRDQCAAAGVSFFFKQWGGRTAKANGRLLDGRLHSEIPCNPVVCEDGSPHAWSLTSPGALDVARTARSGYCTKCGSNGKVNARGQVLEFGPGLSSDRLVALAS